MNYRKDGLFKLENHPLANYLVVKTYGEITKRRYLENLEDCKQQIEEWDEEYRIDHPNDIYFKDGLKGLKTSCTKRKSDLASKYYYVYKKGSTDLVFEGTSADLVNRFNTCAKTINNTAHIPGRIFQGMYNITMTQRA